MSLAILIFTSLVWGEINSSEIKILIKVIFINPKLHAKIASFPAKRNINYIICKNLNDWEQLKFNILDNLFEM